MSDDIQKFKDFKAHMARIAKKNKDEFSVRMTWDERGFHLSVSETADSHVLLNTDGPTTFICIDKFYGELSEALAGWGYKYAA